MEEVEEKVIQQASFFNFNENKVLFWDDIKADTFDFLKRNYKRYLPFLGIILVLFLATFSLFFLLIPESFRRIDILIYIIVGFIFMFTFFLYPSIYRLNELMLYDSIKEAKEEELDPFKKVFFGYFEKFYSCFAGFLKNTNRLINLFLSTFIVLLVLVFIIIVPSVYIRSGSDPALLNDLNIIEYLWEISNHSLLFSRLIDFGHYIKLEVNVVLFLSLLFFIFKFFSNFIFISFVSLDPNYRNNARKAKSLYRYAVFKNKWAFAAFFTHSFASIILIYITIFLGFTILLYFTIPYNFLASIIGFMISTGIFVIVLPYILKQTFEINDSFDDIYLDAGMEISKNKIMKLKALYGEAFTFETKIKGDIPESLKSKLDATKDEISKKEDEEKEMEDKLFTEKEKNALDFVDNLFKELRKDRKTLYKEKINKEKQELSKKIKEQNLDKTENKNE